ncbi:hypothetical protein [Variovorax sp. YR750]|uniref:hypothetical protein n=1 Tax=Variovorax sp. YR750 TaxID=1884384 RepID=UPI0011604CC8|nr:hypothetical protein [Variovorax sp. YR750]
MTDNGGSTRSLLDTYQIHPIFVEDDAPKALISRKEIRLCMATTSAFHRNMRFINSLLDARKSAEQITTAVPYASDQHPSNGGVLS